MTQKIYSYDENGKFIRESFARRDPLEKEERYLIPRNATTLKPDKALFVEGKIVKFTNGSWVQEIIEKEPEPTDEELLQEAKDKKIAEIKILRNKQLIKNTPQTIIYGGNLLNKSFDIDPREHIPLFNAFINKLQERIDNGEDKPTRRWTDSEGNRLSLDIDDFRSLRNHLDERDEQEHDQEILKRKQIQRLSSSNKSKKNRIKDIEDFDINNIIVE